MSPEEQIDLVKRFVRDVLNANDLSRVDEMVAKDFVRHDSVRVENGTEDVRRFLKERHEDYDRLEWRLHEMVAHGDYVAARMTGVGVHRATGKEVTGQGITLIRIDADGKIAEASSEWDRTNLPGD